MTTFEDFTAGTFQCTYIGLTSNGHRWKVTNTITTYHHFTYGTPDEVKKMCETSTEAWKRKAKLAGVIGGAWRSNKNYTKKPKQDGEEKTP